MVLFFIITMVFGQLALGFGLWRARAAPWWAAACLPLSAALNLEPGSSPLWGLVMLLPLIPFLFIAIRNRSSGSSNTIQPPSLQAAATLSSDSPSARRRENADRRQAG